MNPPKIAIVQNLEANTGAVKVKNDSTCINFVMDGFFLIKLKKKSIKLVKDMETETQTNIFLDLLMTL